MTCRVRTKAIIVGAVGIAGFALLTLLDSRIYHAINPTLASREWLDTQLWYLILRHTGSLWTWLAVGAALVGIAAIRRAQYPRRPIWLCGLFVTLSAASAGLAAELLKLIIGRERPATFEPLESGIELVYQGYQFRGLFASFTNGSGLGLPSSHAATAAGGAFALALLFPRVGLVAVALALGCGISRLLTGAHFATDVYAGVVLGLILSRLLARVMGIEPGGKPAGETPA